MIQNNVFRKLPAGSVIALKISGQVNIKQVLDKLKMLDTCDECSDTDCPQRGPPIHCVQKSGWSEDGLHSTCEWGIIFLFVFRDPTGPLDPKVTLTDFAQIEPKVTLDNFKVSMFLSSIVMFVALSVQTLSRILRPVGPVRWKISCMKANGVVWTRKEGPRQLK